MEAGGARGTVTSLSSLFPAEDAHKAAKRVQDTLSEKQKELDLLRGFISDNANLINLVQKLPEDLCHDVMVPFGKAAFFPGRLIHTNEFMVLLGEGYYAERTSKQTVEILKRRGNVLDSQVGSLKAMMDDLKAEASFFDATACEAEAGLVEIREEFIEESPSEQKFESDVDKKNASSFPGVDSEKNAEDDEEYARIMSRLDELEMEEELAARNDNQCDEDEEWKTTSEQSLERLHDDQHSYSELRPPPRQRERNVGTEELLDKYQQQQQEASTNPPNCSGLPLHYAPKEAISLGNSSTHQVRNSNAAAKSVKFAEVKQKEQKSPPSTSEASVQRPVRGFDSHKAFTGSIIERPPIGRTMTGKEGTTSQSSGSQPSKPVSRFKMQRK